MIEITRSLARKGLRVRAHHIEVMVEYHQPGPRPPEAITLPGEALDHFEGRTDAVVTLEDVGAGTVQARWDDGGVPQVREYAAPDKDSLPPVPEVPGRLTDPGPGLLKALVDASQTTARDSIRFAVQKLQLRGGSGEVVATDGKQLLIQGGFHFPWKEDVLIPSVPAFGCRELPQNGPVSIGRTGSHVCLRVGPWTFFLAVDADARFPRVEQVIPSLYGTSTTCRLSPQDATFLSRALPRLPGGGDENAPLTLDLDGHLAVRARAEGQGRTTELVLSRSEVVGPPVRLVSSRVYLTRALELGFTGLCITRPDVPVVCREEARTYLWMPLGADGALPPGEDVLRITSNGEAVPTPAPRKERRSEPMPRPQANGQGQRHVPLPAPAAALPTPPRPGRASVPWSRRPRPSRKCCTTPTAAAPACWLPSSARRSSPGSWPARWPACASCSGSSPWTGRPPEDDSRPTPTWGPAPDAPTRPGEVHSPGAAREEERMSAKHKLNAAHFYGAVLVAGLLGWVTGSLAVFLIALAALLVAGLHAGDIRR